MITRDCIFLITTVIMFGTGVWVIKTMPRLEIEKLVREKAELEQELTTELERYKGLLNSCHNNNNSYNEILKRLQYD